MIYGQRIRQARELEGFTQKRLAEKIGVNQSAIAHIESGRNLPTPELVESIADCTGFRSGFFEREPTEDIPLGSLVFRARASMTANQRNRAYQYSTILVEQARQIVGNLNLPQMRLPTLPEDPVTAAQITRASFGVSPDARIPNLVSLAEKSGVVFFTIPMSLERVDAFSFWAELNGDRPFVILLQEKPGDRQRWTTAHEIGHLVMHRTVKTRLKEVEREADRFAAELLMPELLARQLIIPPVSLASVARLKRVLGVSMAAIVRRAYDLKLITDRQYRYLFEQISRRGWRRREPENLDVTAETPRVFRKMIDLSFDKEHLIERYSEQNDLSRVRAERIINAHSLESERVFIADTLVAFDSN